MRAVDKVAAVVAVGHCRLATTDLLFLVNESSSQNGKGAHAEHAARWGQSSNQSEYVVNIG